MSPELLRVLQIEDSESDAALIVRHLQKAGYDVQSERVEKADSMRLALARQDWDVVIADFQLPQFDAADALRMRNAYARDIPFIIVSGTIGEDRAVEMMRSGAQDYILKERLARLAPAVQRETQAARTRRELRRENVRVEEQLRIQQQDVERRTSNVEQTVRENTMLLQEVHHRVRNNLQVMSSLLSMQINSLGDDDRFAAPLHKAHHRVLALALVHEQLFQCDSSAQLNFTDYVQSLLAKLYRAYSVNPDRVKLVTQIEPLRLKADDAMNCGLILNELLANALKHAFPDDRQGCIRIRLRRTSPTRVECSVTDDGIGLPPKFRYQDVTTLGLSLVPLLVSQMGGNLRVTGKPGAAFTFDWDPEK